MPQLRRQHPAARRRPAGAGSLRTGGSQAEEGQDGFSRVKSAPHTPRRTTRAASRLSRSWPTDRLGRARAGPSRPRRLSTLARRAAPDRHPHPLTGVGHEASKPRERQTRTRSAPTREKRHRRVMHGVLVNRIRTAETTDRAAHESSVSRKTVAEVPLAGLSIIHHDHYTTGCARSGSRSPCLQPPPPHQGRKT